MKNHLKLLGKYYSIVKKVRMCIAHVRKCPYEYGRGKPTKEFKIDGKPQIYCYGWVVTMTDLPLEV